MNRYRHLALPAYLVAAGLILIPFFDASMSVWPWRPGIVQWRFGALGLMSNALMIPAVGMLIILAIALLFGHGRTLRVFGALCTLAALVTGVSIFVFALDAVQTRVNVAESGRLSYTVASITAVGKLLLATLTLVGFAIAGLCAPRDKIKTTSSPLVGGQSQKRDATTAGAL